MDQPPLQQGSGDPRAAVQQGFDPWCPGTDTRPFHLITVQLKKQSRGFPGGAVVENPPANAGDTGSCPGLGGSHMPRSD